MAFLPVSKEDLLIRGWDYVDVILVTGDAYVDHPSYGAALIGRTLEAAGFRTAIIAQPDWRSTEDFKRLGRPRLFFGVTSGNLDSMVANYTANKRPRSGDDYSPGGRAGLRPDRATTVYANRVREAFGDVRIVLGGIEASLRRFAHYDWWEDRVRRSILIDSRADLLVFGMGEQQVVEISRRLQAGKDLVGIRGTAVVAREVNVDCEKVEIPSYEEVAQDKEKFNQAFVMLSEHQDPVKGSAILQKHDTRYVIQFPPAVPLPQKSLDKIYEMPFERACHPRYAKTGRVTGFETVKFSITSHRGCCGSCAFCSLGMHQGRIIQSRSPASVLREARLLSESADFKGTITDVGGPTANLYLARCSRWAKEGACRQKQCLMPGKCGSLELGYRESMKLYRQILDLPGVKHVFIESGMRYDLLLGQGEEAIFLEQLCVKHVSGQLKVAPEHTQDRVLRLMNKPGLAVYEQFAKRFKETNQRLKKRQYLVNYFISAHPGASLGDALDLSLYLLRRNISPEQIQDFMPLPLTASGSMFYTGKDPFTGKEVSVASSLRERRMHRALMQWRNPKTRHLIREALMILEREDVWAEYQRAWSRYDG
ncbi:MAG TPA: YgiQ family radical SAM protein [Syntrophorhabdales bacterium]|nr:YgiQ family radical SAM protein [Syntrophorhabdales bacterium]